MSYHGDWHTPPEQVSTSAQTTPHAPQLYGSKARLVQIPLHLVAPPGQSPPLLLHVPLMQDVPAPQTCPQAPQLAVSLER